MLTTKSKSIFLVWFKVHFENLTIFRFILLFKGVYPSGALHGFHPGLKMLSTDSYPTQNLANSRIPLPSCELK